MTKIFGLCPRCKSRIKINDVESLDGRKIVCRDCGFAIRIRASKAVLSRDKSDELEIVDLEEDVLLEDPEANAAGAIGEDEFAAAIDGGSELPAYRPLTRRPKTQKRPGKQADDEGAGSSVRDKDANSGPRKGKKSRRAIVLICGGALLLMGLVVGGVIWLRTSGFGTPAKFEPPEKYVAMKLGILPLSGQIPEGWKSTFGGGIGGIPIFARFSNDGSISIEIRETEGSSAKGKAKKAIASGQEVSNFGGPQERIGAAPAVAATHEYHRGVVTKDFSGYKEGSSRPIETEGFGEGQISNFTAKEGLFPSPVRGCRASVVHREHQYSIVCKCPPAQFKDVLPVFEKVISSLGPGEKN